MPRLTHEEADKQIRDAMVEPTSLKVQRFRELLAQRGGKIEQPFPREQAPKMLREPDRPLPARTQV